MIEPIGNKKSWDEPKLKFRSSDRNKEIIDFRFEQSDYYFLMLKRVAIRSLSSIAHNRYIYRFGNEVHISDKPQVMKHKAEERLALKLLLKSRRKTFNVTTAEKLRN